MILPRIYLFYSDGVKAPKINYLDGRASPFVHTDNGRGSKLIAHRGWVVRPIMCLLCSSAGVQCTLKGCFIVSAHALDGHCMQRFSQFAKPLDVLPVLSCQVGSSSQKKLREIAWQRA